MLVIQTAVAKFCSLSVDEPIILRVFRKTELTVISRDMDGRALCHGGLTLIVDVKYIDASYRNLPVKVTPQHRQESNWIFLFLFLLCLVLFVVRSHRSVTNGMVATSFDSLRMPPANWSCQWKSKTRTLRYIVGWSHRFHITTNELCVSLVAGESIQYDCTHATSTLWYLPMLHLLRHAWLTNSDMCVRGQNERRLQGLWTWSRWSSRSPALVLLCQYPRIFRVLCYEFVSLVPSPQIDWASTCKLTVYILIIKLHII